MTTRPARAALIFAAIVIFLRAGEPDTDAARAARVEHSLLPPARIAGAPLEPWPVADRLAFHHVPALSVAVIDRDTLAWTRAYGVARTAPQTPASVETLFQAASLSKSVAAAAALTLVQAGRLSLDTDVNHALTSWKIPPAPAAPEAIITLRQLLSHTAGLSVHGFRGYAASEPLPTLPQILDGASPANSAPVRVILPPGSRWQYSGGGYVVVQQLLTDVTGRDFPALVHDQLLAPAGLAASTFAQPLPAKQLTGTADAHAADGTPLPEGAHVYPEMAAAGLWTTPADLARFLLMLGRALRGEPAPLTAASAQAMITPPLPDSRYGLGIGVTGEADRLLLSHSGANAGFRCLFAYYPRLGRGAVLMTNGDNGLAVANEFLRALAREYAWPDYQVVEKTAVPLAPDAFDTFAGRYERDDAVLLFLRKDGRFFVRGTDRPRTEIFPRSEREFFTLVNDDVFAFEGDADGHPTHVVLRTNPPQIFPRAH